MSDTVASSNAGEPKQPVSQDVATESDLLASVISQMEARNKPAEKEAAQPETEETTAEVAEKSTGEDQVTETNPDKEEGAAEENKDRATVLSNLDLDKLSDDDLKELANRIRSRAISEFGDLRKTIRELKAELQTVRSSQQPKSAPFEDAPKIPEHIAKIDTVEALKAKYDEASQIIEWAQEVLDNAEGLTADATVANVEGRELTKAQVKAYLKEAMRMKDKFLPAQYAELQSRAQRQFLSQKWSEKAKEEIEWLADDKSELRQQFEQLVKSPLVEKIKKAVPEVEPELEYILAHSLNSARGKTYHKLIESPANGKKAVRLDPPPMARSSNATGTREVLQKKVKDLEAKVATTGSEADLETLLAERIRARRA